MSDKTPDELWQEFVTEYQNVPLHYPLRKDFERAAQGDHEALLKLYSEASNYRRSAFERLLDKALSDAREDRRKEIHRQNASQKKGTLAWHNQVLDVVLEVLRLPNTSTSSVIKSLVSLDDKYEWDDVLDELNSRERDLRVKAVGMVDPDSKVVLHITSITGEEKPITKEGIRHAIRRSRKKI